MCALLSNHFTRARRSRRSRSQTPDRLALFAHFLLMAKNVDIIFQSQDRARMCPARTLEHPRSLFCRSGARAPLWQTTLADLRALLHSSTMWPTTAGQTRSTTCASQRPRPRKTPTTFAFDRHSRLPIPTDASDFTRAKTLRMQTNKQTNKRQPTD